MAPARRAVNPGNANLQIGAGTKIHAPQVHLPVLILSSDTIGTRQKRTVVIPSAIGLLPFYANFCHLSSYLHADLRFKNRLPKNANAIMIALLDTGCVLASWGIERQKGSQNANVSNTRHLWSHCH